MAGHRFWRLVGFSVQGNGILGLSEARLYSGSTLADTGAVLTCTIAPVSGVLTALRDGLATGVVTWPFSAHSSPGFALIWDFGGSVANVTGLRLGSGGSSGTYPYSLILQSSDTGSNWATVHNFSACTYPGANTLTPAPAGDMQFDKVVLALGADGANGSTVITDSSLTPKIVTALGGAQLSTASSVSAGSSLYFNGTGAKLISPVHPDYCFGIRNFTIRCWVKPLNYGTGAAQIVGIHQYGIGCLWILLINANGTLTWYTFDGATITTPSAIALGVFSHVEVSRWGDPGSLVTGIFVNGVLIASAADNHDYASTSYPLTIGSDNISHPNANFTGYIDDLDIALVDRHSANFTPPPPGIMPGVNLPTDLVAAPRLRADPVHVIRLPGADLPSGTARSHSRECTFVDAHHGGSGLVRDTVKQKNTPVDTPLSRRVDLIDERSRIAIRSTWSDAATGSYEFRGVREDRTYTVISYDHLHDYRAVIADNLTLANGGVELMA